MQNEFHVSLIQVSCLLVLQPLSSRNAHFLEDVRTRLDEVSDIKCISLLLYSVTRAWQTRKKIVSVCEGTVLYCCVLG